MPLPIRSIVLNISSCVDCPKHQFVLDPDPGGDPERQEDVAVVCTLSPNPTRNFDSPHLADHSPHRAVVAACKPEHSPREAEIPDWCPLLHKNLFGKE